MSLVCIYFEGCSSSPNSSEASRFDQRAYTLRRIARTSTADGSSAPTTSTDLNSIARSIKYRIYEAALNPSWLLINWYWLIGSSTLTFFVSSPNSSLKLGRPRPGFCLTSLFKLGHSYSVIAEVYRVFGNFAIGGGRALLLLIPITVYHAKLKGI